jgi:uncharacterized protein (DUF1501 family)
MAFDRRALIQAAGALGLGAAAARFGVSPAFAQAALGQRRFVFIYIPGGWDQLLLLDPREFELAAGSEAAYQAEVQRTQIDTSYRYGRGSLVNQYIGGSYFAPAVYRPYAMSPGFTLGPGAQAVQSNGMPVGGPSLFSLAQGGVPMAIVRGLNMGTLGHEPAYNYFLTGDTPAGGSQARGSSMGVRVAAGLGNTGGLAPTIVPVVALRVQSYTGNKDGRYGAFAMQNLGDASSLLRRPRALDEHPAVEAVLEAYAQRRSVGATGLKAQLADSHERARALLNANLSARFEFMTAQDAASLAVQAQYGLQGQSDTSASATAAFVAQAIKYGLAQFISVGFTGNVDTHGSSNTGHLGVLHPSVHAVAQLVDDLAQSPAPAPLSGSWLDNTTLLVFSEFSRTSMHNYLGGRDHNFTNSCLLIGAGVRPGAVVGASTETGGMQPRLFDVDAQQLLPEGAAAQNVKQRYLLPDDVGATLLASARLDYSEYRDAHPLWGAITASPF